MDHQANKHIRIACHYSRELTANKVIAPQRVPTENNVADVFTKALPATTFNKLTETFMSRQKLEVTAMMITISSGDESDEAPRPASPNARNAKFHRDWPYVLTVKRELAADDFEVVETTSKFSTGRRKYQAIFYKIGANGKTEVARTTAMRLLNKDDQAYYVCQRPQVDKGRLTPPPDVAHELQPSYSPPQPRALFPSYSPSSPTPSRLPIPESSPPPFPQELNEAKYSTITFAQPTPTLVCLKCRMINTPAFALIECTSCNCTAFSWSCACTAANANPQQATPIQDQDAAVSTLNSANPNPALSSANPKPRPRRTRSGKTWTQQVKYKGPIRRHTVYHHVSCPVIEDAQIVSIDFANAHSMKKAACCFTP